MKVIEGQKFDEERALYGSRNLAVRDCVFNGPADGESALKESTDIWAEDCSFDLRYPFWHDHNLTIRNCRMSETCRAALWYSENIDIADTRMHGIKALRECRNIRIRSSDIISPEFGWSAREIRMRNCTARSEYFLMRAEDIMITNVSFRGKYSCQYTKNAVIEHCQFDTKDALGMRKM